MPLSSEETHDAQAPDHVLDDEPAITRMLWEGVEDELIWMPNEPKAAAA